jgi:serine/threonine protein phosphatase 1
MIKRKTFDLDQVGWLDYVGELDAMYVHGHTALDFPQHHGKFNVTVAEAMGGPRADAV